MTLNLTPKQQLFCDEYLVDLNATRAALRAGYSAATALNGALMRLPKIKLYLDGKMAETAQKMQVTRDMVLAELYKIAFGNMGNYFDEQGCIKPMHQLSEDAKAALWSTSVSAAETGNGPATVTKFRLYNKMTALDKIAKHLNFYKPEDTKPAIRYVYLDRDSLTEDDRFEDKSVKKPRRNLGVAVAEAVAGAGGNQESRIRNQDEDGNKGAIKGEADMVLVDGAGIPYGKPRVPNPDNFIDLNETPEQLLKRIGLKPAVTTPAPIRKAASVFGGRFSRNDRGMTRRKPGEKWLLR